MLTRIHREESRRIWKRTTYDFLAVVALVAALLYTLSLAH